MLILLSFIAMQFHEQSTRQRHADDTSSTTHTHAHERTRFRAGTRKVKIGKTNLDFTEARDSEWQWHHQLGHMQVCTSLQTDNHASTPPLSFFTGWMPFLPPNEQQEMYCISVIKIYFIVCDSAYRNNFKNRIWFCLYTTHNCNDCNRSNYM